MKGLPWPGDRYQLNAEHGHEQRTNVDSQGCSVFVFQALDLQFVFKVACEMAFGGRPPMCHLPHPLPEV